MGRAFVQISAWKKNKWFFFFSISFFQNTPEFEQFEREKLHFFCFSVCGGSGYFFRAGGTRLDLKSGLGPGGSALDAEELDLARTRLVRDSSGRRGGACASGPPVKGDKTELVVRF